MPLQQSTAFWKSLKIVTRKRGLVLKHYRPKSDMAALRRIGVSQEVLDDVYTKSLNYNDELLFRNIARFFRKDVATVKVWTKSSTESAAFQRLFNIYHNNDLETAKAKYLELALIFEFYKKGESQLFTGKCSKKLLVKNFSTVNLRRKLTLAGGKADYVQRGNAFFGKERIIWLQKNTDGRITDKFIKISRTGIKIEVSLSFDSKKEYYIAKSEIEKQFEVFLETPQLNANFAKFFTFLRKGTSHNFTLSGATFLDSEFRVSVVPSHNRIANVAELGIYKTNVGTDTRRLEYLTQIRVTCLNKAINRQIFISIMTYREGIFGAILLRADNKKLTSVQRQRLYNDFVADFEIPLNTFLDFKNLSDKEVYKHYLQTLPTKALKIEARSSQALSIYKELVTDNLLDPKSTLEEVSKTCVNSDCSEYFKPSWENKKYCSTCGEILINGKTIELNRIEEKNVALFIKNTFSEGTVSIASKQVLSRRVYVSQVNYKNESADFIPISKQLTENQTEILKFRYPHAVIVTTRDDVNDLTSKGLRAVSLWELAYSIKVENAKLLKRFVVKSRATSLASMRDLCRISVDRITNDSFYKNLNSEVKNLGAELFEADSSVLLDYVFGNCLWLGAKYRGSSLPDGFTAFPMLESNQGCFIWDGKFSEGRKLVMGKFSKNNVYIKDAKANKTIKANGGLKGFVFISNNTFPVSFVRKYLPLTRKKVLKVSFLRALQLHKIVEHYMHNERLILNNIRARRQFVDSMSHLFFSTAKGRKCEIFSDDIVDQLISKNQVFFDALPNRQLNP